MRGECIGIVSPSWGGAGRFSHCVEREVQAIEAMGFRVKISPHALNQSDFVSDTAENRASEIHDFFADNAVRLIENQVRLWYLDSCAQD